MTDPVLQNPHALAVLAAVRAAGLLVGDGASVDVDGIEFNDGLDRDHGNWAPYSVLYTLIGPAPDGPLGAPDDDADLRLQITSVGRHAAEARREADLVHQAVVAAGAVDVEGRGIYRVRKVGGSDNVQRDDDLVPPLFFDVALYGLFTTPT